MTASMLLEVKNHSLHLKSEQQTLHILDNVSFSITKGEVLGIVGESGCGKTILGNSISGLYPPNLCRTEGDMIFNGDNLLKMDFKQRNRYRGKKISMVFQSPNTSLNPVIPIGKQMLHLIREHEKVNGKKGKELVLKWLKEVKLPDPEKVYYSYPHQLSGGMKQRVIIAMALSCRAELIIADEPTTALDVTTQLEILKLMNTLKKEYEISLIVVTHDMGVASFLCDRIMVMYAGQVVEVGAAQEILENPIHPYTKALLKSLPGKGKKVEDLHTIPGSVPQPVEFNSGCRFYSRCQKASKQCEQKKPPLQTGANQYSQYACFYPDKGASYNE